MSNEKQQMDFYQVGGSLPSDAPTYIVRDSDRELYNCLSAGEFCYVLNSRQTGKSSLQLRVMQQLEATGFACSVIDLSLLTGEANSSEKLYNGIMYMLVRDFSVMTLPEFNQWHRERESLSPVQRLHALIDEKLLTQVKRPIIIFIDEVDSVLNLPFSADDLFALIRYYYNHRPNQPAYNRLTFTISGVATPQDLIRDPQRTPFNIGHRIELNGFHFQEALPLARGLTSVAEQPETVLKAILDWTDGQPFLTQKLCRLVHTCESPIPAGQEHQCIESLVPEQIIKNWEAQDDPPHLRTIRERLLHDERQAIQLLAMYQQILQQGKIDAGDSPEQVALLLSGIVKKTGQTLQPSNPIYTYIFNKSWVERTLANLRPYSDAFNAWLKSGDESQLLRGEALQEAQAWAADKSLSDWDHRFLRASQNLSERETQQALVRERRLAWALRLLSIGFAVALAVIVGQNLKLERINKTVKIQRNSYKALRTFQNQGNELNSLFTAMEAGQDLKELVDPQTSLSEYPTVISMQALKKIRDHIHRRNQLLKPSIKINDIQWGPNGPEDKSQFAVIGNDGTVQFWNNLSQKTKKEELIEDKNIAHARFINGDVLIVYGNSNKVYLSTHSGQSETVTLQNHNDSVDKVIFSPDKRLIATADGAGEIRIWKCSGISLNSEEDQVTCSDQPRFNFKSQQENVKRLQFTPDGELVVAGTNGKIQVFGLDGKQQPPKTKWKSPLDLKWQSEFSNSGTYGAIDFSSNTYHFVETHAQGNLRVWSYSSDKNSTGKIEKKWSTEENRIDNIQYTPDGKYFATLGSDQTIRLWDESGNKIDQWELAGSHPIDFSFKSGEPNEQESRYPLVVTKANGGIVRGIMGKGLSNASEEGLPTCETDTIELPNRSYLATFSTNTFELFNVNCNSQLPSENSNLRKCDNLKDDGNITSLQWSPDGKNFVVSRLNGKITLWKQSSQQLNNSCPKPKQTFDSSEDFSKELKNVSSTSLGPDANWIAAVGNTDKVELKSISDDKDNTLNMPPGNVKSVDFSPNREHIAAVTLSATVQIWKKNSNWSNNVEKLDPFQIPHTKIERLRYGPKGEILVLGTTPKSDQVSISLVAATGSKAGEPIGEYNLKSAYQVKDVGFAYSEEKRYIFAVYSNDQDSDQVQFWRFRDFQARIERGCNWLEPYLETHKEKVKVKELEVCRRNQSQEDK